MPGNTSNLLVKGLGFTSHGVFVRGAIKCRMHGRSVHLLSVSVSLSLVEAISAQVVCRSVLASRSRYNHKQPVQVDGCIASANLVSDVTHTSRAQDRLRLNGPPPPPAASSRCSGAPSACLTAPRARWPAAAALLKEDSVRNRGERNAGIKNEQRASEKHSDTSDRKEEDWEKVTSEGSRTAPGAPEEQDADD